MNLRKRLAITAFLLTLPLLLSHCAEKGNSAEKVSQPDLSAKVGSSDNFWKRANKTRPDKLALPPERLEALGEMSLQSRDYESSLFNFLEILRKDPKRYDLHYKVGVIFLLTGELEAAKEELALVLVNRPDMLQAHEAMGMVHLQEKKYPLALEEFQTVLAQDARRASARHLLGITFLEMGQPGKAVAELKRASELDRSQISIHISLAKAYIELKDYRQAVATLKQGLTVDPKNEKLNYQLGMALAGEKKYSDAMEAFMKAGDEAQAYNNIGVHYFMNGQYEEAAKCFQRAIELRPVFYDEAKTNLQRALEKLHQTQQDGG